MSSVILEKNQRLSQSILWKLQDLAYTQFGPEAWSNKGVPFYLTSNPLIAKQFSMLLLGYIQDILKQQCFDLSEPFYIFDLGAGSGKLGYLILKHLLPIAQKLISRELKICYVMTDITADNLAFCQNHLYLKKYIESKNLDFALYHHSQQNPMQLIVQKTVLIPKALKNPLALICTYYFDTIPQDFFRVNKGALEEGRISISVPESSQQADLTPDIISTMEYKYTYVPLKKFIHYYPGRMLYNQLLQDYVNVFKCVSFLFPVGGLHSLDYFSHLSQGRFFMLAGDQGVSTEQQVSSAVEPLISRHASFSMPVNYHLLAKYFQKQGGAGLLTTCPNPRYEIMGGILGGPADSFSNTTLAFEELDAFEPFDYFELTDLDSEMIEKISLEKLLLYIKLGNWDPINFNYYYPYILKKISTSHPHELHFLEISIDKIWNHFFPINSQEGDFIMNLGVLLFEMKKYQKALFYFEKALELSESNPLLSKNIKICKHLLK